MNNIYEIPFSSNKGEPLSPGKNSIFVRTIQCIGVILPFWSYAIVEASISIILPSILLRAPDLYIRANTGESLRREFLRKIVCQTFSIFLQ